MVWAGDALYIRATSGNLFIPSISFEFSEEMNGFHHIDFPWFFSQMSTKYLCEEDAWWSRDAYQKWGVLLLATIKNNDGNFGLMSTTEN